MNVRDKNTVAVRRDSRDRWINVRTGSWRAYGSAGNPSARTKLPAAKRNFANRRERWKKLTRRWWRCRGRGERKTDEFVKLRTRGRLTFFDERKTRPFARANHRGSKRANELIDLNDATGRTIIRARRPITAARPCKEYVRRTRSGVHTAHDSFFVPFERFSGNEFSIYARTS